jgi:hypothetical protein
MGKAFSFNNLLKISLKNPLKKFGIYKSYYDFINFYDNDKEKSHDAVNK